MIWVLVIIVVFAIYNAERMPHIMDKIRNEVPHIVDAGKKASKELKEKAHEVQEKASAKKAKISQESIEKETTSKDN
jgi:Sec-independent protein translocase protein TatA